MSVEPVDREAFEQRAGSQRDKYMKCKSESPWTGYGNAGRRKIIRGAWLRSKVRTGHPVPTTLTLDLTGVNRLNLPRGLYSFRRSDWTLDRSPGAQP
jgi:hypothetical protein